MNSIDGFKKGFVDILSEGDKGARKKFNDFFRNPVNKKLLENHEHEKIFDYGIGSMTIGEYAANHHNIKSGIIPWLFNTHLTYEKIGDDCYRIHEEIRSILFCKLLDVGIINTKVIGMKEARILLTNCYYNSMYKILNIVSGLPNIDFNVIDEEREISLVGIVASRNEEFLLLLEKGRVDMLAIADTRSGNNLLHYGRRQSFYGGMGKSNEYIAERHPELLLSKNGDGKCPLALFIDSHANSHCLVRYLEICNQNLVGEVREKFLKFVSDPYTIEQAKMKKQDVAEKMIQISGNPELACIFDEETLPPLPRAIKKGKLNEACKLYNSMNQIERSHPLHDPHYLFHCLKVIRKFMYEDTLIEWRSSDTGYCNFRHQEDIHTSFFPPRLLAWFIIMREGYLKPSSVKGGIWNLLNQLPTDVMARFCNIKYGIPADKHDSQGLKKSLQLAFQRLLIDEKSK